MALANDARRARHLDRACPDPALRREVESLLSGHHPPDSLPGPATIRAEADDDALAGPGLYLATARSGGIHAVAEGPDLLAAPWFCRARLRAETGRTEEAARSFAAALERSRPPGTAGTSGDRGPGWLGIYEVERHRRAAEAAFKSRGGRSADVRPPVDNYAGLWGFRTAGGAYAAGCAQGCAMPSQAKIIDLRQLLAERLPRARMGFATAAPVATLATGVPALDALLGGGLPLGETTEIVGNGPGSGTAQVLHALLRRAAADGRFLALVDGADSFDADAAEPAGLARLLWVRCHDADEALQSTDLLLRDRNFPLVVLDLKLNPPAQLRRISGSVWHRFSRLREQHRTTLLVVTAQPFVSGAAVRLQVASRLGADALSLPPGEVLGRLRFTLLRQASGFGEDRTALAG